MGNPVTVGYASGMTVSKYSDKPVPVMRAAAAPARLFRQRAAQQRRPHAHPARRARGGRAVERADLGPFGEPLRLLVDERAPAPGARTIEWDGTDAAGAAVAAGSVIIRVAVAGNVEGQIMHLTR